MNQHTPPTDQLLDEIEACVTGPLGEATVFDHTTVGPLVAEVRRLRAERNRYRNAWHNARTRAVDGWGDAELAETRVVDLEAGQRADRERIAELEPYERLTPQQCPAGKHADWLVDSEYAHACPWCQMEELRAELDSERERYKAGLRRADEHVNAMNQELKRYADGKETPVLWSVYNAMHLRAANAESVIASVRAKHKPRTERHGSGCVQCGIVWPCPTYTALDEAAAAVVPAVAETGEAGA